MPEFKPLSITFPLSQFDGIESSLADPIHIAGQKKDSHDLIVLVEDQPRDCDLPCVAHVTIDCQFARNLCGTVAGRGKKASYFRVPAQVLPGWDQKAAIASNHKARLDAEAKKAKEAKEKAKK